MTVQIIYPDGSKSVFTPEVHLIFIERQMERFYQDMTDLYRDWVRSVIRSKTLYLPDLSSVLEDTVEELASFLNTTPAASRIRMITEDRKDRRQEEIRLQCIYPNVDDRLANVYIRSRLRSLPLEDRLNAVEITRTEDPTYRYMPDYLLYTRALI